MSKKSRGFTLLEILLVVGIISVLAGIVIIAINPGRQLATTRNTERKSDLKQIYNASMQYYIDNEEYPATIPTSLTEICDTGTLVGPQSSITCGALIDLSLLVPDYMTAIPVAPSGASSTLTLITTAYAADGGTGYKVGLGTNNKLIVTAPLAELGASIAIGTTTGTTTGGTTGCDATCLALRVGLVGYYPLDTDISDYSGNNNNATNDGSASPSTGIINGAYYFDGVNNYMETPIIFPSLGVDSTFSVSLWFNEDSGAWSWGAPFFLHFTGDPYYSFCGGFYAHATDNKLYFGLGAANQGYSNILSTNTFTSSTWHQAVGVYTGGTVYLYVDGQLQDQTPNVYTGADSLPMSFSIGGQDSVNLFHGSIDEVTIWNRALSGTDITNLYNGGSGRSLIN